MKRCTRKLLAGLLSFGMLLQAASPLSALAAEVISGAALVAPVSSLIVRDGKPILNQRERLRLLSFCMQREPLLTNC